MPLVAIVLLVTYVLFRWINHKRKHEGVMTPLSKEFDHPIPDVEECVEEDEHEHDAKEKA